MGCPGPHFLVSLDFLAFSFCGIPCFSGRANPPKSLEKKAKDAPQKERENRKGKSQKIQPKQGKARKGDQGIAHLSGDILQNGGGGCRKDVPV